MPVSISLMVFREANSKLLIRISAICVNGINRISNDRCTMLFMLDFCGHNDNKSHEKYVFQISFWQNLLFKGVAKHSTSIDKYADSYFQFGL